MRWIEHIVLIFVYIFFDKNYESDAFEASFYRLGHNAELLSDLGFITLYLKGSW